MAHTCEADKWSTSKIEFLTSVVLALAIIFLAPYGVGSLDPFVAFLESCLIAMAVRMWMVQRNFKEAWSLTFTLHKWYVTVIAFFVALGAIARSGILTDLGKTAVEVFLVLVMPIPIASLWFVDVCLQCKKGNMLSPVIFRDTVLTGVLIIIILFDLFTFAP